MIINFLYYILFNILCYTLKFNYVFIFSAYQYNNMLISHVVKKSCTNNFLLELPYIKSYIIKLTNDISEKIIITIPEGYTVNNMLLLIDHLTFIDRGKFEKAIHAYKYRHLFLKNFQIKYNWLEGYLFPDTYVLNIKSNPIIFFNSMLNNFNNKIYKHLFKDYKSYEMHNFIIIASIIERESKIKYEQPIISGIIHNRINSNMKLEIDATIQYIIEHKNKLLFDDIYLPSIYNTYMNIGLPNGPISAPGYYAIFSSIFPHKNKFYFYVAKDNGQHFFSKTFKKHNKYINKIIKGYLLNGKK